MNVRDWLLEDKKEDNNSTEPNTISSVVCHSVPVQTVKTEKMKQLELSFKLETGRMFATESVKEMVTKPRMSKEEKLKKAAIGTLKMTTWLKQMPAKTMEWDDDPDLPELEEIKDIEERELEKVRMEKEMADGICREVVVELITMTEAVSMASNVMEQIVDKAWEDIKTESAWRCLEDDPRLRSVILTRIRVLEEARVKESEDKLQEERLKRKSVQKSSWEAKKKEIAARAVSRRRERAVLDGVRDDELVDGMEGQVDTYTVSQDYKCELDVLVDRLHQHADKFYELGKDDKDVMEGQEENLEKDVEEHTFLDTILSNMGVEPMKVKYDADWEIAAHADLEEGMEECRDSADVDVQDDAMRTYLNNTNLLSKRMVSATISVEPHLPESELRGDGEQGKSNNGVDKQDIKHNVSKKGYIVSQKRYIVSTGRYICDGQNTAKRKVADSGSWWLPSTWRSTRRPRWPTSTWSTLGRRASTWNLETAPDEVDSLIRESLSHKELWKSLKLTSATNIKQHWYGLEGGEDGGPAGGGVDGQDDDVPQVGDEQGVGPDVEGAAVEGGDTQRQDRDGQTLQEGGEGGGPVVEGGGAQVPGEVPHTHGGRGGEQVARSFQRRKFRLKNGLVRDSLLQLDIRNYTQHTGNYGVGGSSEGVNLGSNGQTREIRK